MFENPRRGRQARNFTTNVPKILDLKSSSEQIFFRKLSLGAPDSDLNRNLELSTPTESRHTTCLLGGKSPSVKLMSRKENEGLA